MKIQPFSEKILVKLDDEKQKETKTKSGFIIIEREDEQSSVKTGTVVSVGAKVQSIKPKDRVIFQWGIELDKDHMFLEEKDVFATFI